MRSPDSYTMQPLFTIAMDEEFTPPADPEFRTHTLAGLIVATYLKGVRTPPQDNEASLVGGYGFVRAFRYSPSWASVEATAFSQVDPRIQSVNHLTALSLRSPQSSIPNLDVVYSTSSSRIQWGEHDPILLVDRPSAVEVREQLAVDAQSFFDRADPLE